MAMVLPDRCDWQEFTETRFQWEQGEHVVIVGPIGSGKSTLMRSLLWERDWVTVLCSKKKDRTYDEYLKEGYIRAEKWPPPMPPKDQRSQHVLLWPKIKTMDDINGLAPVFHNCLWNVFIDESWAVGLDDLFFLCKKLRLTADIEAINYQVRSMGVSMVACMQRPAWVPRSAWDQASHAFIRRLQDVEDLRTIRGLSLGTAKELEEWTRQLKRYEWLYLPVAHGDTQPPCIIRPPA